MDMKIFLTVDVEIWAERWDLSARRFPRYYEQYILGRTAHGQFGLPYQLRLLKEYGLKCTFFVEPLFSYQFGRGPLADIVAMIQAYDQDVQLHLHTEWVGRMTKPLLPGGVKLHLREYDTTEQRILLEHGVWALKESGVTEVSAFRAGNFSADERTLRTLPMVGVRIDSSYNRACRVGPCLKQKLVQPQRVGEIQECPVAVFRDGFGRLRHAQLGAAGFEEMREAIAAASSRGWPGFVAFWHSRELLNQARSARDRIVMRRFERLCSYLADNAAAVESEWLSRIKVAPDAAPAVLVDPRVGRKWTVRRMAEQLVRAACA